MKNIYYRISFYDELLAEWIVIRSNYFLFNCEQYICKEINNFKELLPNFKIEIKNND